MENNNNNNPMEEYQREMDRAEEAKHDAAAIIAEKQADMMGIYDPEERTKLVEGYRALFSKGPTFPRPTFPANMLPPQPVEPDPCCTTEDENGNLISYDWLCLLDYTFKWIIHRPENMAVLYLYNRTSPIQLDRKQTKHLLRYIQGLADQEDQVKAQAQEVPYGVPVHSNGYGIPRTLLAHPVVRAILDEPDEGRPE